MRIKKGNRGDSFLIPIGALKGLEGDTLIKISK
jgi:hypothetical protein